MNKRLITFLTIATLSIALIGCEAKNTSTTNNNNSLTSVELKSKEDEIWNIANESADYVYNNLFYSSNFEDSEIYLIDIANKNYTDINEQILIDLYNQAKKLYDKSVKDFKEENIKNLLSCYYISRYAENYYLGKEYEDYSKDTNYKNLSELQYNIYDVLFNYHSNRVSKTN